MNICNNTYTVDIIIILVIPGLQGKDALKIIITEFEIKRILKIRKILRY